MDISKVNIDGTSYDIKDAIARATTAPTGAIMAFAGATAPTGWRLCNGTAISRTTYSDLFAVIGTTYGAGDGSTTFNVPDYRELALVGVGENTTQTGIENHDVFSLGEFKDDQMQTHTHTTTAGQQTRIHWTGSPDTNLPTYGTNNRTGNNNGRTGDVTRGKRMGVNFIIKL